MIVSPFWNSEWRGTSCNVANEASSPSHDKYPKLLFPNILQLILDFGFSNGMITEKCSDTFDTIPTTPLSQTTPMSGFIPSLLPLLIVI